MGVVLNNNLAAYRVVLGRMATLMLIVIIQTNICQDIFFQRGKCLKQETQKEEKSYKFFCY